MSASILYVAAWEDLIKIDMILRFQEHNASFKKFWDRHNLIAATH